MTIYLGSTLIPNIYLGGTQVQRVYLGAQQVWPTNAPFSATPSKPFLFGHWPQTTAGTLSDSVTINCSGGSGSYWIVSVTHTGAVSTNISGLTVAVRAVGQNTRRVGTLTIVVTDGFSQITLSVDYEFAFGPAA